jgi:hypothetical protein
MDLVFLFLYLTAYSASFTSPLMVAWFKRPFDTTRFILVHAAQQARSQLELEQARSNVSHFVDDRGDTIRSRSRAVLVKSGQFSDNRIAQSALFTTIYLISLEHSSTAAHSSLAVPAQQRQHNSSATAATVVAQHSSTDSSTSAAAAQAAAQQQHIAA